MRKFTVLFISIFLITFSISAKADRCTNVAFEIILLSHEMNKEFEKTKSSRNVSNKYQKALENKINQIAKIKYKSSDCFRSLDVAATEATFQLKEIAKLLKDDISEIISYDKWFALQNTRIETGKKYSFIACVLGSRNSTAKKCNVTAASPKRIFYNTDDIKSSEIKKQWINALNENKCVTAYVSKDRASVVDIKSPSDCK